MKTRPLYSSSQDAQTAPPPRGGPRAAAVLLVGAALAGCAVSGTPYPEVMAHAPPVDGTMTRVVFLRPAERFDDNSASPAVIRIGDETVARLGYGGFFYVDVPAGTVAIAASGRGKWLGSCEVQLHAVGGDTVYLDDGPRMRHAVAGLAGAIAGANVVDAALPAPAVERLLLDAAVLGAAAGVGDAVASSVESIGRKCGGPYRLDALSEVEARPRLQALAWSR